MVELVKIRINDIINNQGSDIDEESFRILLY